MSKKPHEINDDEIRIISAEPETGHGHKRLGRYILPLVAVLALLIVIAGIVFVLKNYNTDEPQTPDAGETVTDLQTETKPGDQTAAVTGYVQARDTVVNGRGLLVLSPENARPRLVIGTESLGAPGIILATQAADVRGDNGQIAGTYVLDGELISRGEAKAGFCAVVNGQLSIGIADASPKLEEALTPGGYFFRQYPLVVGGQIVENKPKGKAIRKALAEIGDKVCVVMSKEKLTFHDFSRLLVDAGVRNAIYLVGSTSYGFYINDKGQRIPTGQYPAADFENINFIIWE